MKYLGDHPPLHILAAAYFGIGADPKAKKKYATEADIRRAFQAMNGR